MGVLVVGRGDSGTTMVFLVGGVGSKSFLEVGSASCVVWNMLGLALELKGRTG